MVIPLTDERRREVLETNVEMASRALRSLALAYRDDDGAEPAIDENGLTFAGLVGMAASATSDTWQPKCVTRARSPDTCIKGARQTAAESREFCRSRPKVLRLRLSCSRICSRERMHQPHTNPTTEGLGTGVALSNIKSKRS